MFNLDGGHDYVCLTLIKQRMLVSLYICVFLGLWKLGFVLIIVKQVKSLYGLFRLLHNAVQDVERVLTTLNAIYSYGFERRDSPYTAQVLDYTRHYLKPKLKT
jgi:hypothetical protein